MRGFAKFKKLEPLLDRIDPDHLQFVKADVYSLVTLINKVKGRHPMVVEVGCWEGYSTAILANEIGRVFVVDHWQGNPGTPTGIEASLRDVYGVFRSNLIRMGLWDAVFPMVMDSETAASIIADNTLDFVFIDANHLYKSIKQDINLWLPKLKKGGILCGHDAEFYYSKLSDESRKMVDGGLDKDYFYLDGVSMDTGIHPGVVKALYECFDDTHLLMPKRMWYYKNDGTARSG